MDAQSGCYILRNGDSTPTFRLVKGAGTLPAHRCYLELPAGTTNAPARVRISIGETTGIDGIQASDVQAVQYVNALGQTSDRPFRGVNIVVTRHNDGTVRTSKAVF